MRFARLLLASTALLTLAAAPSGCSDPVPATPQGAWSVSFSNTGSTCSINGHSTKLGEVTATEKQQVIADGQQSTDVTCKVAGSGKYRIEASANQPDRSLTLIIDELTTEATSDNPAPGRVSYSAPDTAGNPYTSPTETPCAFYFPSEPEKRVTSGRVWVAFRCAVVTSAQSSCGIQQGYAIFENCEET